MVTLAPMLVLIAIFVVVSMFTKHCLEIDFGNCKFYLNDSVFNIL
jgi:hypothetical protein